MKLNYLILAAAAVSFVPAYAQTSINLGNYSVTGVFGLDRLNGASGGISGLEGSAITYGTAERCSSSATKARAWLRFPGPDRC